jgi:hypothetical protein
MKTYKQNLGKITLVQVGLAILLNTMLITAAWARATVNVKVQGETVGLIDVDIAPFYDSEGLEGAFQVTKRNNDGSTMTIEQLQNEIGSKTGFNNFHFNWLQIVTRDTAPRRPNNVQGNPLFSPYIDLPKNGYELPSNEDGTWADDIPWYLDEKEKPENDPNDIRFWNGGNFLDERVEGTRLTFEDSPGGDQVGSELNFLTFLVGDFGNQTYDFLTGFEWSTRITEDETTDVTRLVALGEDAELPINYQQQVLDEFGDTRVPVLHEYRGYYTDNLGGLFNGAFCGGLGGVFDSVLCGGIGGPPSGYFPNDDGSFGSYPLGFSLPFFGNTYNSFYLNNNGNISFGSPIGAYTPTSVGAQSSAPIIAPYWADVDTRGTGTVAVRTDIPNQVIVTWDKVGYYNQNTDKLASFQLVLRGPDYPTPANEGNVGFFYKDVQWETGDASGGTGGFGGTPAAIGFGDGLSSVNPSELSLNGSQQPGISQLVSNRYFWFNLPASGDSGDNGGGCNGGGGSGGGGCARTLALRTVNQSLPIFDIDKDYTSEKSKSVPESTPALGLLALGAWGIVKALKIKKDK